jgi:uncharacterized protein (TIRG00374 family)
MTSAKYRLTWKTILLTVAGLAAFFIYIIIFNVDLLQIAATAQRANLQLYLVAAASAVFEVLLFSVAWNILLRFLSVKLSVVKSFLYVWFGIYIDILIPAESISGEIAKVYLISREHAGSTAKATASLVAQRLISMGINVGTLFIGAALLLMGHQLEGLLLNLTLFLVAITFAFFVLILLLCVKENWTLRIVDAVIHFIDRISRGRWKLVSIREEVIESTKAFHAAMRDYARAPKTLFAASALYIIAWIMNLSIFYLTFLSIGYTSISWSAILVVCSIFMAVKSIPVGVPFEVGLPEITLTTLFILLGIPPDISATATILTRILTHWLRLFIGFVVQQYVGVTVSAAVTPTSKSSETSIDEEETKIY